MRLGLCLGRPTEVNPAFRGKTPEVNFTPRGKAPDVDFTPRGKAPDKYSEHSRYSLSIGSIATTTDMSEARPRGLIGCRGGSGYVAFPP
jgi:hypothetical protein